MYMIVETEYSVNIEDIDAIDLTTIDSMKTSLNYPTGNFFYDPWQLKDEYVNTPWEEILATLPFAIGEARVICLESKECYTQHTDIDDRYHLNIFGDEGYLIDLKHLDMYKTVCDGKWYEMDAGRPHTAANFGQFKRVQLVVRKLLQRVELANPLEIKVIPAGDNPRYTFDNTLSLWLNRLFKDGTAADFEKIDSSIVFKIENNLLTELEEHLPADFDVIICR